MTGLIWFLILKPGVRSSQNIQTLVSGLMNAKLTVSALRRGNFPMDPNLFHIDWEQLIEALAAVVVLSFVVERAMALVFEHRLYVAWLADRLALALVICARWDFDFVGVLLRGETTTLLGKSHDNAAHLGAINVGRRVSDFPLVRRSPALSFEQFQAQRFRERPAIRQRLMSAGPIARARHPTRRGRRTL